MKAKSKSEMKRLQSMHNVGDANPHCLTCKGEGWVCENHPNMRWRDGLSPCCGGAGMPCRCNPLSKVGRDSSD